ncbi:MAG TPA: S53 family peptidase [Gaiellaceae bacterium]|jgi:subtilase family serine protease
MRKRVLFTSALAGIIAIVAAIVAASGGGTVQTLAVRPMDDSATFVSADTPPPSQADCVAIGRRCFTPSAMANSYNYAGLHGLNDEGQGKTIAIMDSFGSSTIRQDLANFNDAFGLPHLCGETGPSDPSANCSSTTSPRFDIVCYQGCPAPNPPPSTSQGTHLEAHDLWALEVALDVEWAHATAPLANIMLVTTPTAETLGVQGFQQLMNAEDWVVTNHKADVITQSFGAAEGSFNGLGALKQLRQTFVDAQANNVTVFASTGDFGSLNNTKQDVTGKGGGGVNKTQDTYVPYPSVSWPASDPLVTAVGGTYLCTNAETGLGVDSVSAPAACQNNPGDREPGWVASGGGYSIYFTRPSWQTGPAVDPPGGSFTGTTPYPGVPGPNQNMRGIPDVSYQASALTGVLIYNAEEGGWFVIGGTSASSPQWAGLLAMADQMAGHDLGFINPALYSIANNAGEYATDFYDPTHGFNGAADPRQQFACCYPATKGWDPVTGLGTPNAANLIPNLITAASS